jgi:hypothetical protein
MNLQAMAKRTIFTVGLDLPGDEFEQVQFSSDRTLLDADIILYEPTLGSYSSHESYEGKSLLSQHSSFETKRQLDHWRTEIIAAVNAGKLVIVFLAKPIECYRYNGEKRYSGTGRSQVTTNIVVPMSSYDAVPKLRTAISKSGTEIRIEQDSAYLTSYWAEFSKNSSYEVEIDGDFNKTLLKSRAGDRTVGAAFHGPEGTLLLLPPLRYDQSKFERYSEKDDKTYWTPEALKFGKRLVSALVGLGNNLKKTGQETPPPDWSMRSEYRVAEEASLEAAISKCIANITSLQAEKLKLEANLVEAGGLRRLLFEQGKPLEHAVLQAMKLLGFDGQPFADGESEFDGIFISPEGRCLGEAEGKDNKAINIEKFSQLERNLQEDFARDEVTEHAKGILFGNAYRLAAISDRSEFFTAKCISAAKRIGAALVRTPDLFAPAKYIKENPSDKEYAVTCRAAIFRSEGEVVVFPPPPLEGGTAKNAEAGT